MKRIMKSCVVLALLLGLPASSALPQVPPPQAPVPLAQAKKPEPGKIFDDWIINCEPQLDKSSKCFATQFQYTTQSGQRITTPQPIMELGKMYSLSIGYLGPKGELQVVAFLPLNIDIPAGAPMKLDPGPTVPMSIVACIQEGCRATATLDAAAQRAISDAKGMTISIVPYVVTGDKPAAMLLSVSTRGLAPALASLK